MPIYNRFEDLPVWKLARKLTILVYDVTHCGEFRKDYGLRDQIRRASISVMSNIAEGFEHETQAQFISYLGRAKASAGEIRCQLYIANDLNYLSKKQFQEAVLLAEECSKQIFGYIRYLRTLPNSPRIK
jgi:four helix bundle protein